MNFNALYKKEASKIIVCVIRGIFIHVFFPRLVLFGVVI